MPSYGLQKGVISGTPVSALGATNPFVKEGMHDSPIRSSSNFIENTKLVLDRLTIS